MTLLVSITESVDIRISKLMVFTCLKLEAAAEAMVEAEVKFFHKIIAKR